MAVLVSVIVPVLDDLAAAERLLVRFPPDLRTEILVVDGGHDPGLEPLAAAHPRARVIRSRPGRAVQMNAGAAQAQGDWLLFLHADSTLPESWLERFDQLPAAAHGGWFRFALDDPSWQARLIERAVAWRVRTLRLPYGDQGLFVRRRVFAALNGYKAIAPMEDVEFVRRLVASGPVIELPIALGTSARRWRQNGWFAHSEKNLLLVTLYFGGIAPARLARFYR